MDEEAKAALIQLSALRVVSRPDATSELKFGQSLNQLLLTRQSNVETSHVCLMPTRSYLIIQIRIPFIVSLIQDTSRRSPCQLVFLGLREFRVSLRRSELRMNTSSETT